MSFLKKLFRRAGASDEAAPLPEEPRVGDLAGVPVEAPSVQQPAQVLERQETEGKLRDEPVFEPQPASAWLRRLKDGLSKSSRALSTGISDIFTKRRLNEATLAELEDILLSADLGLDMSARITAAVASGRYDREIEPEEVKQVMAEEIAAVMKSVEVPLVFDAARKPFVILVVGVNGSGKTTTIGKLGAIARREGLSVMFAACDTFRAAAIEQLSVWGQRISARVVSRGAGADAAGVAFDALSAARREASDILLVDTAGRLHNKAALMAELEKIVRVLKKQDPDLPHATLLVLDATTGQNALTQVEMFHKTAGLTGLIMTKLDGTARGGILVAIAERFALPVHAIGVGEGIDDLQPFDARAFSRAIVGLELED
jgi:fused signal recognition particle receptor